MFNKLIISESEKNEIRKQHNLTEQKDELTSHVFKTLLKIFGFGKMDDFENIFSDYSKDELSKKVGSSLSFDDIVKEVIDTLEGGYYHPDMLKDGRVKDSRYGNSGETMMGIDRQAGGTINKTSAGIKFWNLIDTANARTKWNWNYRGGHLEDQLTSLAGEMIKVRFNEYGNKYLTKEALEIVLTNKKLLFMIIID